MPIGQVGELSVVERVAKAGEGADETHGSIQVRGDPVADDAHQWHDTTSGSDQQYRTALIRCPREAPRWPTDFEMIAWGKVSYQTWRHESSGYFAQADVDDRRVRYWRGRDRVGALDWPGTPRHQQTDVVVLAREETRGLLETQPQGHSVQRLANDLDHLSVLPSGGLGFGHTLGFGPSDRRDGGPLIVDVERRFHGSSISQVKTNEKGDLDKVETWLSPLREFSCCRWHVDHSLLRQFVEDFKRMRPNFNHENNVVAARLLPVNDLVQRYYGTVYDRFGVPLSGLCVLNSLVRLTLSELALSELNCEIVVTSGDITFVVTRLEERGLVARRSHPHDGRAVLVQRTRRGRRVVDQLNNALDLDLDLADAAALVEFDAVVLHLTDGLLTHIQSGIEAVTSPRPVVAWRREASNPCSRVSPKRDGTKGDGTLRDGSPLARGSKMRIIRLGDQLAQGGRIKVFAGGRFARDRTADPRPRVRSCLASAPLGKMGIRPAAVVHPNRRSTTDVWRATTALRQPPAIHWPLTRSTALRWIPLLGNQQVVRCVILGGIVGSNKTKDRRGRVALSRVGGHDEQ
jgi:DNA-binding MarR family transcriptional regulator